MGFDLSPQWTVVAFALLVVAAVAALLLLRIGLSLFSRFGMRGRWLRKVAIDPETGVVAVGEAVQLRPHGKVPISWPSRLHLLKTRGMRNGYVWHDVGGVSLAGEPCIVQICAFLGSIERINFALIGKRSARLPGADQAEAHRQIDVARAGLRTLLKRPFETGTETFPWGVAYAVYDDRSGGVPQVGVWFDPPPESAT